MDDRYDAYCAVDPLFYDSLSSASATATGIGYAADRPQPAGWESEVKDDWLIHAPVGGTLPAQGWKIHVSARLDNAERVLTQVMDYCQPRGIPFKHLRGPRMLLMRNSKYARRGGSGKFVTVYPRDDAELELTAKELSALLDGEQGPYILSDLRYGDGPVYLRYGGFAARYCLSPEGQVVPAIADATGTLVPDRRDPVFHLPDWVTLPDFLAPHLAARNAASTTELPYRIEKVVHFSNGGGLYEARDTRTDTRVVLKEARPYAGLDATGADAVTRLRREAEVLRQLADVPHLVRVHDEFSFGGHEFLALEFVEGRPLNQEVVQRYPLVHPDADRAGYTRWALDVHRQVAEAVEAIHAHGIVYGDLHMFNIMVGDDGAVTLIDFEVAAPAAEASRPALRNQAFAAPRDRVGPDVDRYALACLRLALFLPLTAMLRLAPTKAAHLADVVAEHFPVDRAVLDETVAVIVGDPPATGTPDAATPTAPDTATRLRLDPDVVRIDPDDWPGLRDRLVRAITASATPQRDDRLFPGDIRQFSGNDGGLNLAHGAAGVLWALHATGAPVDPRHVRWLIDRVREPASGSRLGFFDGLHGVAYVLDLLGHRDEARRLLDRCLDEPWPELGNDLVGGLPGIALNLTHFAGLTGEERYEAAARHAVDLVVDRLGDVDSVAEVSGGRHPYAGLMRGGAGVALMLLGRHEREPDERLLDHAATALRQDLRRCVRRDDGHLEVNEGWRTMPYLAEGSVGVGLVLDRYLRHRPDEGLAEQAEAIRRCADFPFYAQSGLFAGRAGIVAYLAGRGEHEVAHAQARLLGWHALPYADGTAFPGDQLLRLSMDLATGTAGVLAAVAASRPTDPVRLPLLGPTDTTPAD
ncbi:class III lanthionine synthetase LanKC [Micromonospora sp. RL09-050-HVF-A]|uniref:class III lanthionine synthetase LanKC n=1 Tax=Micromonospora sp. RL09-050-HVF-A TaxID=1703433 RepID=UPI001C5E308D|nr:class III lanthionine synthetase LanKC [Micromonospora sp. RL09-050-HVF-A]MBW4701241.1 class III lanthionine synthetase LanKC [Micromonospora sp. RL09-050-HVF-A]